MGIYLYSACDIYSYTWKETIINSIVWNFMKHSDASDIRDLLSSDFGALHQLISFDFKLINGRGNVAQGTINH